MSEKFTIHDKIYEGCDCSKTDSKCARGVMERKLFGAEFTRCWTPVNQSLEKQSLKGMLTNTEQLDRIFEKAGPEPATATRPRTTQDDLFQLASDILILIEDRVRAGQTVLVAEIWQLLWPYGELYKSAQRAPLTPALHEAMCALTGALHEQLRDTGLVTVTQWNEGIAPHLKELGLVIDRLYAVHQDESMRNRLFELRMALEDVVANQGPQYSSAIDRARAVLAKATL